MLNGHGDDIHNYKTEIISNFSSNVFARQDMTMLDDYLCKYIRSIHTYPEPDAHSVAAILANQNKVASENICITNGATEAIYLIAQAFGKSNTAIIIPTFSEYEDACRIHGHNLHFYKRVEDINSDIHLLWLCNPNNPTGYVYNKEYLETIIKEHPKTVFIFDQSYEHFTEKEIFSIKEATKFKNVILLHSMTKHYTIPGLRLGYITGHKDILTKISAYRMPWSVNQLAIEAGNFLLSNTIETINIPAYLSETKRLQSELNRIERLTVYPTDTHFFLCKLTDRKASELKSYLIEKYGILIRDAGNFRGLDESYFRIATQSAEENNNLIRAIKGWI